MARPPQFKRENLAPPLPFIQVFWSVISSFLNPPLEPGGPLQLISGPVTEFPQHSLAYKSLNRVNWANRLDVVESEVLDGGLPSRVRISEARGHTTLLLNQFLRVSVLAS